MAVRAWVDWLGWLASWSICALIGVAALVSAVGIALPAGSVAARNICNATRVDGVHTVCLVRKALPETIREAVVPRLH